MNNGSAVPHDNYVEHCRNAGMDTDPRGHVMALKEPIRLDNGTLLDNISVAYQAYGTLNIDKSNVVLLCHALSMDQHAANPHPITGKPGWWNFMIGPGKVIDTDRFYVVCPNVLGSCMGSTGPESINPETNEPWGIDFPVITIGDMVKVQAAFLDRLGIGDLFCIIGGSMGGMQVLEWTARYPDRVFSAVPIATAARHSAQNIAFHEVGRQAIMADTNWDNGRYYSTGEPPRKGLSVARMAAHITYLSESGLHAKFGRELQDGDALSFGFGADFQVESYLRHQGSTFVDRFDANSYLYLTRAMDYFDLAADHGGALVNVWHKTQTRFCVVSFTSDWLFPTSENRAIVHALSAVAADVSFVEIDTDKGHDSFLVDVPEFRDILRGFLGSAADNRNI